MKRAMGLGLVLIALGCGKSSPSAPSEVPIEQNDAAVHDSAISEAAADAPGDHVVGDGPSEAATDSGPPVTRTMTTRPLYGTSTKNLLLDTFATSDESWGHFFPFYPGSKNDLVLVRLFMSDAPGGVTAPVAALRNLASSAGGASTARLVAEFIGGSGSLMASVYVSASDASGKPIAYASVASKLEVAIYPPAAKTKIVLERDDTQTLQIGDREWARLAFAAPSPVAEGGWFEVDIHDLSTSWLLRFRR